MINYFCEGGNFPPWKKASIGGTGQVQDTDGNTYDYITIGTQQWFVQNLKTTEYSDGTAIRNITNNTNWSLDKLNNLLTSWTDETTWPTFVSAGPDITDIHYLDANEEYARSNNINVSGETSIRLTYGINVGVGSSLWLKMYDATDDSLLDEFDLGDTMPPAGLTTMHTFDVTGLDTIYFRITNVNDLEVAVGGEGNGVFHLECETGAYCWYDNDIAYKTDFGALYNWHAVNNVLGLAPTGWRVPSKTDWETLITYIGGDVIGGGKLKEVGTTHWNNPNIGATDDYGFKAFGGGTRLNTGTFDQYPFTGYWWSSTEQSAPYGYNYFIGAGGVSITQDNNDKFFGMSVRCMRDI